MSRAHGEGCIIQRKDGRWQGSLQVGGTRQTIYGKSKKEVAQKLRDIRDTACKSGRPKTRSGVRTVTLPDFGAAPQYFR